MTPDSNRDRVISAYQAVRDNVQALFSYITQLSDEDAETLHDYLADKIRKDDKIERKD